MWGLWLHKVRDDLSRDACCHAHPSPKWQDSWAVLESLFLAFHVQNPGLGATLRKHHEYHTERCVDSHTTGSAGVVSTPEVREAHCHCLPLALWSPGGQFSSCQLNCDKVRSLPIAAVRGPVPQCVDSTWKLPSWPLRTHTTMTERMSTLGREDAPWGHLLLPPTVKHLSG